MSTKRALACLLALAMLMSLAVALPVSASADEIGNITMETSDVDRQLSYIFSQVAGLRQNDGQNTWYYTVTDLDHDGSLEFVAASQHPQDRSTNLKIWEVGADRNSLVPCSLSKDEDESFPDILTDTADTFCDQASNTWFYLLYDNVVLSDSEVYTVKTAVTMQNNVVAYQPYAIEHTVVSDGRRNVTHTDVNGIAISPEQYNAAGFNAFADKTRTSTAFEWLTSDELGDIHRVTDSYSVFTGMKAPTETFPVPRPSALNAPAQTAGAATAAPIPTAVPTQPAQPVYLNITKNPTNENRTEGNTAYFVSSANVYESLSWTFVSPDGGEYSSQAMQNMWGGIGGASSTTLSISDVTTAMNNWGAYCTFYYQGQTARTTTAYLYVSAKQQHKGAPSGTYSGYVTDWNYSSVTLNVANTVTVTIPWSLCDVDGDLYYGANASVDWNGKDVTYCYIIGNTPQPQPVYGSMSGSAYEGGGGYAINLQNGSQVFVDAWLCNVEGRFYDGCSAVVYYNDYPSSDNIYYVEIYGNMGLIPYGWDDSSYYNDFDYIGGWAGSNYYDDSPTLFEMYNSDGSTYDAVLCPGCGALVSMAYDYCPNCGYPMFGW